jgi:hypothetical protein
MLRGQGAKKTLERKRYHAPAGGSMRKALALLALGLPVALAQGKITVWTHFGGPELEWLKAQGQDL